MRQCALAGEVVVRRKEKELPVVAVRDEKV